MIEFFMVAFSGKNSKDIYLSDQKFSAIDMALLTCRSCGAD
jgi:hypothetical protein